MGLSRAALITQYQDVLEKQLGITKDESRHLIPFTSSDLLELGLSITAEDIFDRVDDVPPILLEDNLPEALKQLLSSDSQRITTDNQKILMRTPLADGYLLGVLSKNDKGQWLLHGLYTDSIALHFKLLNIQDEQLTPGEINVYPISTDIFTQSHSNNVPLFEKRSDNKPFFTNKISDRQIGTDLHRSHVTIAGEHIPDAASLSAEMIENHCLKVYDQTMLGPLFYVLMMRWSAMHEGLAPGKELDYQFDRESKIVFYPFSENNTGVRAVVIEKLYVIDRINKRYYRIPGYVRTEIVFDEDNKRYFIEKSEATDPAVNTILQSLEQLTNLESVLKIFDAKKARLKTKAEKNHEASLQKLEKRMNARGSENLSKYIAVTLQALKEFDCSLWAEKDFLLLETMVTKTIAILDNCRPSVIDEYQAFCSVLNHEKFPGLETALEHLLRNQLIIIYTEALKKLKRSDLESIDNIFQPLYQALKKIKNIDAFAIKDLQFLIKITQNSVALANGLSEMVSSFKSSPELIQMIEDYEQLSNEAKGSFFLYPDMQKILENQKELMSRRVKKDSANDENIIASMRRCSKDPLTKLTSLGYARIQELNDEEVYLKDEPDQVRHGRGAVTYLNNVRYSQKDFMSNHHSTHDVIGFDTSIVIKNKNPLINVSGNFIRIFDDESDFRIVVEEDLTIKDSRQDECNPAIIKLPFNIVYVDKWNSAANQWTPIGRYVPEDKVDLANKLINDVSATVDAISRTTSNAVSKPVLKELKEKKEFEKELEKLKLPIFTNLKVTLLNAVYAKNTPADYTYLTRVIIQANNFVIKPSDSNVVYKQMIKLVKNRFKFVAKAMEDILVPPQPLKQKTEKQTCYDFAYKNLCSHSDSLLEPLKTALNNLVLKPRSDEEFELLTKVITRSITAVTTQDTTDYLELIQEVENKFATKATHPLVYVMFGIFLSATITCCVLIAPYIALASILVFCACLSGTISLGILSDIRTNHELRTKEPYLPLFTAMQNIHKKVEQNANQNIHYNADDMLIDKYHFPSQFM